MKTLFILVSFLLLANCSAHSVKLGKRCTTANADGTFEKSFIWIIDKETVYKIIDPLGRESVLIKNRPFFYISSDGVVRKIIIID